MKRLLLILIFLQMACVRCPESNTNSHVLFTSLTEKEKQVDKKLTEFKKAFDTQLSMPLSAFYSLPFHEAKQIVDTTTLFRFLDKMPKGGLLHIHSGGITDAKWIIEHAKTYEDCYVYMSEDNDQFIFGQLSFFKKDKIPEGFVRLQEKIADSPEFEQTLYDLLILREDPERSKEVWIEFEKRFKRIMSLISYRPFFNAYYKTGLQHLIENNVQHLEIRYIFGKLYDFEVESYPIETQIKDLLAIVSELNKEEQAISLNLIYTSFKFLPEKEVENQFIKALELKQKYPDFIRGFDLVADEKTGNSISFYDNLWAKTDSLEMAYRAELPFHFHAGESNSIQNKNIKSTLPLDNKRLGHGLNLTLFPEEMEEIKTKGVLVEINPWSNKILEYVADLRNHPAREFLTNDLLCSISSDDPGVFGYTGLTYDFWIATMAWELNLLELKNLVFNSIEYSALHESQKKISLSLLEKKWAFFINSYIPQIETKNEQKTIHN